MPPPGATMADLTSEQLNSISLPASILCRECGRNKAHSSYANKHLRDYKFRKFTICNYVLTSRNTTARCRRCTGEQVHELKCEGQCGVWKSLDKFSKNQRTKGENWCKDCVLWKESLQPGGDTIAGPGQDLAPAENDDIQGQVLGFDNPEEGDDDDEFASFAPCSQMSAVSVTDGGFIAGPAGAAAASSVTAGYVPPHLRGRGPSSTTATPSVASSAVHSSTAAPSSSGYVPPHLRGIRGAPSVVSRGEIASVSSISNPYEERQSMAISRPAPISQPARANGNWARAVGTRNGGQRRYTPRPPPPAPFRGYDSDGSPDEM